MTPAKIARLLVKDEMMSEAVAEAASTLFAEVVDFERGERVISTGDVPRTCHLLLDGVAFRHLDGGPGRQITTFLLPGDWSDIHGLFYPSVSYSITTQTRCQFAVIDHSVLSELMDAHPLVSRGLWLATLREAAIEREWIKNVGQRTEEERIAHLLCELVVRFQSSGLCDGLTCVMPITSLELTQSTACSPDTVKRVLEALEELGTLIVHAQAIHVIDFVSLKAIGGFEASYLELPAEARA